MAIGVIWDEIWSEAIWNTAIWAQAAGEDDTTPDQFDFTDQSGVALETVTTSAAITVSGINAAATITVTGGNYIINGGTPTSEAGTVSNGDEVQAQGTSSDAYLTAVDVVVTIGGVAGTFRITTRQDPALAGGWAYASLAVNDFSMRI